MKMPKSLEDSPLLFDDEKYTQNTGFFAELEIIGKLSLNIFLSCGRDKYYVYMPLF